VEAPQSKRVFLVHGRDEALREAVRGLVLRFGFEPVILHEQANRGQTLVEKFERESVDVAYAIIMMTPDDEGRLYTAERKHHPMKRRSRQNVVWEYGYFVAHLGRSYVAVLTLESETIEAPTDMQGIVEVRVGKIGDLDWRIRLAVDMRAVGLDVDVDAITH
jgi:predicted nucleotide-binding protein